MGLLDKFRKKKKEKEKADVESTQVMTELEKLCGDDKETYEALLNTMFLDPRKIEASMEEAVKNAKKFEKAKDSLKAKIWYKIAGGLAIYEGNVKKVTEFFSKYEKISPGTKYLILKNPETAVVKAQEYYQKHLKA
ncbi:MAG: hypothetical protein OEY95_01115 [Candidatus Bathyarchaeota archaeon]|nr:hypothetical protein [Candidatus Bathyarchaeota archaeon]